MEHVLKNIDDMKYNELQKLAKSVGIKANMKIDKLQKALREYYQGQKDPGTGNPTAKSASCDTDEKTSEDEEAKKPTKRVTKKAKRGGRRRAAKKDEEEASEEMETSSEDKQVSSVKPASKHSTPVPQKVKTPVVGKLSTPRSGARASPMTPQMRAVMNLKMTKTPTSQKRKRSGSLPRPVAQSNSKPSTPVAPEPSSKRLRRSTFEKSEEVGTPSPQVGKSTSPGVQAMLGVMKPDMSSAERKATLLKALDDKVQKVKGTASPRGEERSTATQIPRFAAFLASKKDAKKPITPGNKDWTKVHEKEFNKFDSIDVYLEKKRQRTKSITKSVSKVNEIIEDSKRAISNLKSRSTPNQTNNENKPVAKAKVDAKPKANLFRSPSPFRPTVFKTKNINTNFTVGKASSSTNIKTPVTQGPVKKATPKAVSTVEKKVDRKSLGAVSAKKLTGVTPFKFTATLNTTMPDMKSAKKPVFDLKASLAKPVTWKAHKGKLKPMEQYKQPGSTVKSPKPVSRDDRRNVMANHRANKKLQSQMQRRGIQA